MKVSCTIRNFLRNGICTTTSLKEAVQMVAVLEVFFAVGFLCHGIYLCTTREPNDDIYGILYIFCGIAYLTLTCLLWITSGNPTLFRCRIWIMGSILTQFSIIALMIARNCTIEEGKPIWSANIWILCALVLQVYMIGVGWAFALDFEQNEKNQPVAKRLSSSDQTTGNGKDKTEGGDNGKTVAVVAV